MRWIALAVLTSCYSPSYKDCTIPCTLDCPSGFHCVGDRCRPTAETAICPMADAMQPADAPSCWSYQPLNFDACALPPLDSTFQPSTAQIFNTDTGMDSTGTHGVPLGPDTWLIHVGTFSIPTADTLQIQGTRALIIVSDNDVHLDGWIRVDTTTKQSPSCVAFAGFSSMHNIVGQGGGGGGFGSTGGTGGKSSEGGMFPTPGGSSVLPTTALVPGCPGEDGQTITAQSAGGKGGNAGGALQITSNGDVFLSSQIYVNGHGGGGGGLDTTSGCGGGACGGGGGGGGSGGTIIIEGHTIMMSSSSVCAVGGTGGQGAGAVANGGGDAGPNYIQSCQGAGSSKNASAGGIGGAGSSSAQPGSGGADGVFNGNQNAGGGGGGGAGIITFHGMPAGSGTVDPNETVIGL